MGQVYQLVPYLRVRNARAAISYYSRVFGAVEQYRLQEPGGRVGHAELKLGPLTLMLSDEYPELGIVGPESIGGCGASLHLRVDDVDACFGLAVREGAGVLREPSTQFFGERTAMIRDPFGHEWVIGQQLEVLSPDEIVSRWQQLIRG
jgi:uncharacterized glyoxalase superfamily protein PhnB